MKDFCRASLKCQPSQKLPFQMLLRIKERNNIWYQVVGQVVFGTCKYVTGQFSFLQCKWLLVLLSECLCVISLNNSPGVTGGLGLMIVTAKLNACTSGNVHQTPFIPVWDQSAAVKNMLIYLLWAQRWNMVIFMHIL